MTSPGRGGGAAFIVRLPKAAPPTHAAAQVQERRATRVPRRILVVDDNRDAAKSLAQVLALLVLAELVR